MGCQSRRPPLYSWDAPRREAVIAEHGLVMRAIGVHERLGTYVYISCPLA